MYENARQLARRAFTGTEVIAKAMSTGNCRHACQSEGRENERDVKPHVLTRKRVSEVWGCLCACNIGTGEGIRPASLTGS